MKAFLLPFLLIAVSTGIASAQVQVQLIPPAATGNHIKEVHGAHIALYDATATSRHQLLFMIEGTGASATECRKFDSCFATMGFNVISIDYLNNVISTACSLSTDSNCFDNFRQEILFGTPVSSRVEVDSTNSIVNRFSKLLLYLAAHDPKGGWSDFLQNNQPRWDKIVVAGHSQGAGHAAYLGKRFPLAGVLMLSGPQDYLQKFKMPAPWQSRQGRTQPSRYYAFLHIKDPFNYHFQVADVAAVTGLTIADTTMVLPATPVHSTRHILVNAMPTAEPHSSTVNPVFIAVWKYMVAKLN